ncbi:MAG: MFS transporter [Candidatus Thorarchaeota archaeon]
MSRANRATIAFFLAFALQSMGQAIIWQFVTLFLRHELRADSFLLLTLGWVAPAFMTMAAVNFWGWFSDGMKSRKPFMIVGFVGYAITFLLVSFVGNFSEYLMISMFGAFFSAAALPVGQAYLTTDTEKKGEQLGIFLAVQSGGWLFGAFSSGFFYDSIGMFNLYRIAAIVCIGATGICAFLVKDRPPEANTKKSAGFGEVLRRPGMVRLTTAAGLSSLGMNAIAFMMAIMIVDELHGAPFLVGISNSVATFIAVIATGYIGRVIDRRGPVRILILAYISYVVFAIVFGLVRDPITAAIMWALPIYPLSSTAAYTFASLISGDDERGRAMGLVSGAQNAGAAIGPIIGGLAAEYIFLAVQPISWINMAFNLLALVIAITLIDIGRKLRVEQVEEEPQTTTTLI